MDTQLFPKDFTPPEGTTIYDIGSLQAWFLEGVFYCYHKPGVEHTLEMAKKHKELMEKILDIGETFVVVDIRDAIPMKAAVRNFYNSSDGPPAPSGMALIVSSPFSRALGNLLLLLKKPEYFMRLFTSVDDALKWRRKNNLIHQKNLVA